MNKVTRYVLIKGQAFFKGRYKQNSENTFQLTSSSPEPLDWVQPYWAQIIIVWKGFIYIKENHSFLKVMITVWICSGQLMCEFFS